MKYKQSEVKQKQIEWRRDKVLDLSSKGQTEREIAKVLQALSLAKECYAMKLDLLSSATVVDRAVKFIDRHKDSGMSQNDKVTIVDTPEPQ